MKSILIYMLTALVAHSILDDLVTTHAGCYVNEKEKKGQVKEFAQTNAFKSTPYVKLQSPTSSQRLDRISR